MTQEAIKLLRDSLGDGLVDCHDFRGDDTALIERSYWARAASLLKEAGSFDMLVDLCAVDYPNGEERFEVVAHLYSTDLGKRMRIKTRCPESDPLVASLCDIWRGANWFEREAYDLFGIEFLGHPNLKRILCHQEFEGHPLRKDFPKTRRGKVPVPQTLMDEIDLEKNQKSVAGRTPHASR